MTDFIKEKLRELFFDSWCDTAEDPPELQETIEKLSERFQACRKDFLYIESIVKDLRGICERQAYIDGFLAGVELVTGRILK